MSNFVSEFIDGEKNILIPALQRDYVQGERKDIIRPFIDELLSALKGSKQIDLNYIYGSNEKNCFVPIDGQQRLITLWLLHLYLYTKLYKVFSVSLNFDSREFANEFSKKLVENLRNINSRGDSLKAEIINSSWFVKGWIKNRTVNNMLNTLCIISEVCQTQNEYQSFENITFSFFDMKINGLTDDIYVKMNGRGRPLSYFENLKSLMDEKVIEEFGQDSIFARDWQNKMDNEWTDFFWSNRNRNQNHHEEIDDEQKYFFYRLLLIYWVQAKDNESLAFQLNNIENKESVSAYLHVSENNFEEDVQDKIIEILREGRECIPLYWIEQFHLFNKKVFEFIMDVLNVLCELSKRELLSCYRNRNLPEFYLSDSEDETDINTNKNVSLMYKITMSNKASYEKTIPYFCMLFNTPNTCRDKANFNRWCRLFRNLIINTKINKDNIGNICKSIRKINEFLSTPNSGFYETLAKYNLPELVGFYNLQLREEQEKTIKIAKDIEWEAKIIKAEQFAFFRGAIRFLFRDEKGNLTTWENFDKYYDTVNKYFNAQGVTPEYQKNAILLRTFIADFDNFGQLWDWFYDNTVDTWRALLLSDRLKHKYYKQINHLLCNPINIHATFTTFSSKFKNKHEQNVHSELVKTMLLSEISKKSTKLNWYYNQYCLYPYNNKNLNDRWFIANKRNNILSELLKKDKITKPTGRVKNCDIFSGWSVEFEYKGDWFCWDADSKIYKWDKTKGKKGEYQEKGKNISKILTLGEFEKVLKEM